MRDCWRAVVRGPGRPTAWVAAGGQSAWTDGGYSSVPSLVPGGCWLVRAARWRGPGSRPEDVAEGLAQWSRSSGRGRLLRSSTRGDRRQQGGGSAAGGRSANELLDGSAAYGLLACMTADTAKHVATLLMVMRVSRCPHMKCDCCDDRSARGEPLPRVPALRDGEREFSPSAWGSCLTMLTDGTCGLLHWNRR